MSTGTPPPTRTYGGVSATERIAARRQRLLAAGQRQFGTRGYAAVRVKDVCSEAGLATRYFYESFEDLTDLFRAVHEHVIDTLYARVTDALEEVEPPSPVMRAAIAAFVDALLEEPTRRRIVFTEPTAAGEAARERSRAALRRFEELVAGIASRQLPEDLPPARLRLYAVSIVGTLDHVIAEWLDGQLDLGPDELVDWSTAQFLASFAALRRSRRTAAGASTGA